MREGNVFSLSTPGGGTSARSRRGVPHPALDGGGTPARSRKGGYPIQPWTGGTPARSRWGYPSQVHMWGTPYQRWGTPQVQTGGTPGTAHQGWVPPARSRWGYPSLMGVPHPLQGDTWATTRLDLVGGWYPSLMAPPPPPPRRLGQQEYSLRGGRQASCVHAGGFSS